MVIPDNAKTTVNVLSYKYQDFEDLFIMPSKGNFYIQMMFLFNIVMHIRKMNSIQKKLQV